MKQDDPLRRFVRGDSTAFDTLVETHQGPLLRFAARLTGSEDAAQDVVQETFMRLVRNAEELAPRGTWTAWMYQVCRNLCSDRARKEARMTLRHARVAVPETVPPETPAIEKAEENHAVQRVLDGLQDPDRELLLLKIHEGRSYREIAAITGLSLHRVGTSIHRGLRQVAVQLRDAGLL